MPTKIVISMFSKIVNFNVFKNLTFDVFDPSSLVLLSLFTLTVCPSTICTSIFIQLNISCCCLLLNKKCHYAEELVDAVRLSMLSSLMRFFSYKRITNCVFLFWTRFCCDVCCFVMLTLQKFCTFFWKYKKFS